MFFLSLVLMSFSPHSRLSGIVTVQSFIYIKLYPTDLAWKKAIVSDFSLFGASLNFDELEGCRDMVRIFSEFDSQLTCTETLRVQDLGQCSYRTGLCVDMDLSNKKLWRYIKDK